MSQSRPRVPTLPTAAGFSSRRMILAACLACGWTAMLTAVPCVSGQVDERRPLMMQVSDVTERVEMTANTSRILTLGKKIPRAQVNNPDIVHLTPLSPTQVQISALRPGVTQINLWDEDQQVRSLDVVVYGDAQELVQLLRSQFPTSSIRVLPLQNSVALSGYVDNPQHVSQIVAMAQDYYPRVHNNILVSGVQQVNLHVKVMEVSRTKLRTMGFDWAGTNGSDFVVSSVSGVINAAVAQTGVAAGPGGDTIRFGLVDGNNRFFGFLEALQQNDLAKILAEPTLVTVSGRPAYFNVGGEIPIQVPQSLGTVSIEYKRYGTQVDFVPIVLGNGRIRLEVRPRVSELDASRGTMINNTNVPGFRVREVDTGVEMRAGQTLALAGLVQTRVEAQHKGVPYLSDLPWIGAGFRRVTETNNEIELLILVTPELVAPLERHEVPPGGPGLDTCRPGDVDFFWRGHIEVPCCDRPGAPGGAKFPYQGRAVYPEHPPVELHGPALPAEPQGEPIPPGPQAQHIPTPAVPPHLAQPARPPASQPAQTMQPQPSVAGQSAARPRTAAQPVSDGGEPGFIGPIGYDMQQ